MVVGRRGIIDELGAEGPWLDSLPLDSSSLVWIIGAFKGKTARLLIERYGCRVRAFDPQAHAIEHLNALAEQLPQLTVEPYALGPANEWRTLVEAGNDACNFYRTTRESPTESAEIRTIGDVWSGEAIDLVLMNCEGTEWWLLPRMARFSMINRCARLLVQFHEQALPAGADELEWEDSTRALVARTHSVELDLYPTWIAWTRS